MQHKIAEIKEKTGCSFPLDQSSPYVAACWKALGTSEKRNWTKRAKGIPIETQEETKSIAQLMAEADQPGRQQRDFITDEPDLSKRSNNSN